MSTTPESQPRQNGAKDILLGIAAAFAVTLVASLAVFPFALEFLPYISLTGSLALSTAFPIFCDIYVSRRYFARRLPASRYALVGAGAVLSSTFTFLVWGTFLVSLATSAVIAAL